LRFQTVGWDPRGVGASLPLVSCFNSTLEESVFYNGTSPENGIEAKGNFTNAAENDTNVIAFWDQLPEVDELLYAVGQRCLALNGDILTYVGTVAVRVPIGPRDPHFHMNATLIFTPSYAMYRLSATLSPLLI
jgi:hypothetical protein